MHGATTKIMNKTYQIKTLSDIWNLPSIREMEACLSEIAAAMLYARMIEEKARELMIKDGASREDALAASSAIWPVAINWEDDGKGEVGVKFSDPDGSHTTVAMLNPRTIKT